MGGDSCSEGSGFEFQHRIPDGHCTVNFLLKFVRKRPKLTKKSPFLTVEVQIYSLIRFTRLGFEHAYDRYFDEADWFMKADDDTYLIVENLKFMLAPYNTSEPIWFGCKYHPYVKVKYSD